jgi:hypothetical protein
MRDRVNTLLLHANGVGWKAALADTVLEGLWGLSVDSDTDRYTSWNPLVRRYLERRYEALSYLDDWREAFAGTRALAVRSCNINNLRDYFACLRSIADYQLIVVLHSAAGDSMGLLSRTAWWFTRRRGKLVVFLGNEHDLIREKIRFAQAVAADYICSQLPVPAARWLYEDCTSSQVLMMPHALNPALYHPRGGDRTIDIGFRGSIYSWSIGDAERTNIIRFFKEHGVSMDLQCDIGEQNIPRGQWAEFLRRCKGTVGAESGTYYLDRTGRVTEAAKAYVKATQPPRFQQILDRHGEGPDGPMSGKTISSRHFEAIGTKTCQILIQGHYNGILDEEKHYIGVRKDLSNIEDAVRRFKDAAYRQAMVDRAYEYVMAEHTYAKRVEQLLGTVLPGLP